MKADETDVQKRFFVASFLRKYLDNFLALILPYTTAAKKQILTLHLLLTVLEYSAVAKRRQGVEPP